MFIILRLIILNQQNNVDYSKLTINYQDNIINFLFWKYIY